jgi:hypothetical protein
MNSKKVDKRKCSSTAVSWIFYLVFLRRILIVNRWPFSKYTNRTYSVKEGLPSNALYRSIIDKKGYLWIATELGLSRFDGKRFRNYSTTDGLTDNEITDLFVDSSGLVWAIPFRRTLVFTMH